MRSNAPRSPAPARKGPSGAAGPAAVHSNPSPREARDWRSINDAADAASHHGAAIGVAVVAPLPYRNRHRHNDGPSAAASVGSRAFERVAASPFASSPHPMVTRTLLAELMEVACRTFIEIEAIGFYSRCCATATCWRANPPPSSMNGCACASTDFVPANGVPFAGVDLPLGLMAPPPQTPQPPTQTAAVVTLDAADGEEGASPSIAASRECNDDAVPANNNFHHPPLLLENDANGPNTDGAGAVGSSCNTAAPKNGVASESFQSAVAVLSRCFAALEEEGMGMNGCLPLLHVSSNGAVGYPRVHGVEGDGMPMDGEVEDQAEDDTFSVGDGDDHSKHAAEHCSLPPPFPSPLHSRSHLPSSPSPPRRGPLTDDYGGSTWENRSIPTIENRSIPAVDLLAAFSPRGAADGTAIVEAAADIMNEGLRRHRCAAAAAGAALLHNYGREAEAEEASARTPFEISVSAARRRALSEEAALAAEEDAEAVFSALYEKKRELLALEAIARCTPDPAMRRRMLRQMAAIHDELLEGWGAEVRGGGEGSADFSHFGATDVAPLSPSSSRFYSHTAPESFSPLPHHHYGSAYSASPARSAVNSRGVGLVRAAHAELSASPLRVGRTMATDVWGA